MDNLTLSQVIKNNIRLKNLEESGGGGELWDDITSLFVEEKELMLYRLSKDGFSQLVGTSPIRITIETYSVNSNIVTGNVQFSVSRAAGVTASVALLINTIYNNADVQFSGNLLVGSGSITYNYGVSIPEETERPKILKVERLVV